MAQRWSREPGWYPDSVGDADFRWWDGTQWTQAVADTLWAPEPENPPPYANVPTQGPASPMAGAPTAGPLPEAPEGSTPLQQVPMVVEVEDERRFRRPVLIGVASVVAVAGLVVGGFLVAKPDPSSEGRTSAASSEQEDRTAPRARPDTTPSPSSSPSPSREKGDAPTLLPRYPEPGEGWVRGRGFVPHSQVHRYITEEDYSGDEDWGAFIAAGEIPLGVTPADELAETADRVAQWYAEKGFASDKNPSTETLGGGPGTVGSRPSHHVEVKVDYEIDGLKADWDRTTVVVFSLGPGRRPGVFIASVPNTHAELRKAVEKAKSSLELTKGE